MPSILHIGIMSILILLINIMNLFSVGNFPKEQNKFTIIDGDTIKTSSETIRLACIDAPEIKQDGGKEAKNTLTQLVSDHTSIYKIGKGKYGRILAILYEEDKNLNRQMIEKGHAWAYYTGSCADPNQYHKAQEYAYNNNLGIWGGKQEPIPPWKYRQGKRQQDNVNCPEIECHPSYLGVCIPTSFVDVNINCYNLKESNIRVIGEDLYNLDRDDDGWGCEK